jgi:hypothetical protein
MSRWLRLVKTASLCTTQAQQIGIHLRLLSLTAQAHRSPHLRHSALPSGGDR